MLLVGNRVPSIGRGNKVSIEINLDKGIDLLLKVKDALGVVVKLVSELLDSQAAIVDSTDQQGNGISDTNTNKRLLAKSMGHASRQVTNGEDINNIQALPESFNVSLRRKEVAASRELLLGVEQSINGSITSNLQVSSL